MAALQDVITLSMPQVIDLALNSPEIGAVNFNLLHNLLHILVQQLQMTATNVEFRGNDGEKIKLLLSASKNRPNGIQLTEYSVTSDTKGQKTRTEVVKTDDKKAKSDQNQEVLVLIEAQQTKTPQLTVCMSQKTILGMQNEISNLKQHVAELVELPKNCNLLEALKNKDKPVVEMFQILTLAKRVDGAEAGLQKLASLVEDMSGETGGQFQDDIYGDYDEAFDEFGEPIENPAQTSGKGGESSAAQQGSPQKGGTSGSPQKGGASSAATGSSQKVTAGAATGAKDKSGLAQSQEQKQTSGGDLAAEGSQTSKHSTNSKTGENRPVGRKPPPAVVRIANSEKRLQAVEDTLKAYTIPPPIIPQMIYPTRIDLPQIELNPAFFPQGAPPIGTASVSTYRAGRKSSFDKISMVSSAVPHQQFIGPTGVSTKDHPQVATKDTKKEDDISRLPTSDALASLQRDINKIKKEIRKMKSSSVGTGGGKDTDDSGRTEKKRGRKPYSQDDSQLGDLEAKVKDSAETMLSMDQNFHNQLLTLQSQFASLEMEVNDIMQKMSSALPGGDTGVESIGDLFKKMQGMQIDIENIAETTATIVDDLTTRKLNFESLHETVELMKTIKADKEDLEDALADKADKCAINRKVSHDQFDTACDELSRGIEEALEKLTNQELLWQQALDEIQFEISNKLDKMELGPLRDFINNKLRMLQERMKSLTALKKEQEAAGTKSKFLRNVNCISCDKDVVMRKQMDASLMPQPRALPPSRSMAPYLAYELDALRKQQKTLPNSRNLNHFESAISGGKSPRTEDHVCNRYCGGSHTVTTPQQRVTRMGHFLAQWGPGAVPVTDAAPTKEEPKQDVKSSQIEQGASGDQKKSPTPEGTETVVQREKKSSKVLKGSVKSGSASHVGTPPEAAKGATPPSAGGPAGDEKGSIKSQEKVKSPTASAKGSQGSAKRGSKGSVVGSIKSKQGSVHGSKEAVAGAEKPTDIPKGIPEETPSEVAAVDAPPADNPAEGVEEAAPGSPEEEKAPDDGGEPAPDAGESAPEGGQEEPRTDTEG